MYAVEVSPDLISTGTDAVVAEATAWQSRPLEPLYPVVFFDALRVTMRDEGVVRNKAVDLALGVLVDGTRDILGVWIEQTEGAKFWMKVFTELRTRGCADILIAVTDGLNGMREALEAIHPATTRHTCLVHPMRHSLDLANWKERKPPTRRPRRWPSSRPARGASGFPRLARRGAAVGRRPFRSSRFRPRFAA